MTITTNRTAITEHNDFLERFLTYQTVFQEFFKTMDLIERGEVLKYETYPRLTNNFLLNLKIYSHQCVHFIEKYSLTNTEFERTLNNYFLALITSLRCIDSNSLNRNKMQLAKREINDSSQKFITALINNLD